MKNLYPKILIFSQPFSTLSGGGITLTNLYSEWPEDKLAVISYPHMLSQISTEHCKTYYQLGYEELHWTFPFSLIKEKHRSGLINAIPIEAGPSKKTSNSIRNIISTSLLNPLLKWLGLVHAISILQISDRMAAWLDKYAPDLLYFQISNRESIRFALELIEFLKIPSVIHMMDDWPSTLCSKCVLKFYWGTKIDKEFRRLLNKVDLHLSICDEMSSEYNGRYGHHFIPFHNTIDLGKWSTFIRKDISPNNGSKIILFSGRIGTGIKQSLFELADAVDKVRARGIDARLHIQSPKIDSSLAGKLNQYNSVVINPIIEYSDIPRLYATADILVIANDFSQSGVQFLRYSMPTKAPEYLISGTPILVYASSETALYKLFHSNKLGHCVVSQEQEELSAGIKLLLSDLEYRKTLSKNAVAFAVENFDSRKVRSQFQNLLKETAQK
ncbi:MAG: glycosyltransferase [Bacteroidales bacterium]|nr:glycosyltransferase [Bacteroidales bacterium]